MRYYYSHYPVSTSPDRALSVWLGRATLFIRIGSEWVFLFRWFSKEERE